MPDPLSSDLERFGAELCADFLSMFPISGISVSAFPGYAPETSIFASDATSAGINELQLDLGEGPRWGAMHTRRPVLLADAKSDRHAAWPVFAKAILDYGVGAIFVYPLQVGTMDVGFVELYSSTPGPLSTFHHSLALRLADAAAWALLRHLLALAPGDSQDPDHEKSPLSRREVHQATGMVLAQAGTSATSALLLLRAHAFTGGRTVHEGSHDVISRALDFTPHHESGDGAGASTEQN